MNVKKYLIVLILRILETHSDKNNPISQIRIAEMISAKYPCDRKTVCRNIKFLKEVGYPIAKTKRGFYMEHKTFSRCEINLILDLVQNSDLKESDKEDLKDRLLECLSRYYKR